MSRVFYPKLSRTVAASTPHPIGTEYYISIGEEDWDGIFQTVVKVQMMYNGKIAGRKSPSYPIGTSDSSKVAEAIAELENEYMENMKSPVVIIPAKKPTYVSVGEFIELIVRIPEGKVGRWEDIEAYLKRIHHAERIELDDPYCHWPAQYNGVDIPYWRMVGSYGYLSDDRRYGTVEMQEERLNAEGLETEPCGHKDANGVEKSTRVKNYKKVLFDVTVVPSDVVTNTNITSMRYPAEAIEYLKKYRRENGEE